MAPTPVDPAAAVKLWLKAANSGEASDKWGRVQRASWMVSWLWIGRLKRNLFEKLFRWILQSFCAEAARSCVEGKDANLLSLVQFLFRDFDLAVVLLPLACIASSPDCQKVIVVLCLASDPRQPWLPT